MPRPAPFTRNQNYTDWQTAHPSEPLPGTDVDSEFNETAKTTVDLVDFTRFIQRDDGSLLDGVVGTAQLDPTAFDNLLQPQIDEAEAAASAAAASAGQAGTSQTAAASSAATAATNAAAAGTSASTANTAASAAASSATAADASKTAAAGSVTTAQTAATASQNSATASSNSAGAALTSANAASASATQAAANINAHAGRTDNPHAVTAAQVGAATSQWNASQIASKPVDTGNPAPGQVLLWDGAQGKIVWSTPSVPVGASYVPPVAAGDVGKTLTAMTAPSTAAWADTVDAVARSTATSASNAASAAQATANAALPRAGGTMTGNLILAHDPALPLEPATRQWVLANAAGVSEAPADGYNYLRRGTGATWLRGLALGGGTMTGALTLAGDPTGPLDAATQQYVDNSASSHSTMALDYTFQTATTAPPNSGYVRLNNATQSAATTLWIHKIGTAGKDESLYLALLTPGSTVILQDRDDSTRVQVYTLSGPLVDSGAYDTVPVTWKSGNSPLVAQRILVTLVVGAAGTSGGVTVGDTAPASPTDGAMWFDSVGLQLYLRYNDGNSAQWVPTINQINGGAPLASPAFTGNPTAPTPPVGDADTSVATSAFVAAGVVPLTNNAGRNLVMNGLFNINQRALSSYTASGYTLDRWRLDFGLDTTTVAPTPLGDAQRAAIGDEAATNAMVVNVTGNAGAGAFTCVSQFIEDVRRLAGKTVTVSFWAYATSGSPKIGAAATQVFGAGGSPNNSINGVATPALTAVPVRYTVTVAYPTVSGKTVGTGNDHYSRLALFFSSGATNNTFAGGIGVQSAVFVIWGVQLEIGSVATPLDYGGTPQQQLAACERFYQVVPVSITTYAASGFAFGYTTTLRTVMRATPTTVISGQSYTSASGLSASPNGLSVTTWATSSVLGMVAYAGTISASADL